MSPASLALPRTDTPSAAPDGVRIGAMSVAITINLAVLLAALRPLPPASLPLLPDPAPIEVRTIRTPPPQPPPPPVEVKPLPHATVAPVTPHHAAALPIAVAAAPPVTEGTIPAPVIAAPSIEPVQVGSSQTAVEASLAYRAAPLHFPPVAIRQHMHGTVLLRVLVDPQGRPQQVLIERSSGYGLLDRSARQQVLASWRFEPAMVGGQAVPAWARVPVAFDLREL